MSTEHKHVWVSVIVRHPENPEHVLMHRRGGDAINPESWGVPGGKVEPGELYIDAAARELLEETGLTADLKERAIIDEPRGIVVLHEAGTFSGEIHDDPGHGTWTWVDPMTLDPSLFQPALRAYFWPKHADGCRVLRVVTNGLVPVRDMRFVAFPFEAIKTGAWMRNWVDRPPVDPLQLVALAETMGWELSRVIVPEHTCALMHLRHEPWSLEQLIIPLRPDYEDFGRKMNGALEKLASSAGVPVADVMARLNE